MIAGLSIGLTLDNILNQEIGFTYGLINERNNQSLDDKDKIIHGTANMLMD